MAGSKIADLYAQIGVKVDSSKLQTFLVKLSAVKMRVNQLSSALNNANRSMANSYGMQSAAERLKAAQQRTIAAQYNAQAAASRAAAAAARAANVHQRTPAQSRPSANVRMGSNGISAGGLLAVPASIAASLGGVYALTNSFVNVNKQVDNFKAGMLLSSPSAAAAAYQIEWLKKQTQELGIAYRGATQDFTQFSATTSAMGATQSQTRVMYTDIMKIQSALSLTPDQAEGMTRALTQMVSKGKVMSEELKGQLAERVPGAVAIMAKAMGKTVPQLFEMMKDGALDASVAVPKFLEMYAKLAQDSGALKAAQGGLAASINNLDTAWFEFMETLGAGGVKDLLKSGLDWLTGAIKYLTLNFDNIKQLFVDVYDNGKRLAEGFLALAEILAVAAVAMGVMWVALWLNNGALAVAGGVSVWNAVGGIAALANKAWVASAAFTALWLPIIVFGALIGAAYLIWQDLTSEDSWFLDQANSANKFAYAIQGVYNWFTKLFEVVDDIGVNGITMPPWLETALRIMPMTAAPMMGLGAMGLLPSQKQAAGGASTTNSGGNLTIGTYIAKPGETIADTKNSAGYGVLSKSTGNAASHQ